MVTAVRNSHEMLDVPLETAFAMAGAHPADFLSLGTTLGRIAPGFRASLVAVDADWRITGSWIDGVAVL